MEIVVRATVIFWLLWVLLRASGKRELAEMTPFELIVLVVVGDLIQQGVTGEDMSVTGAALAATTVVLWSLMLSFIRIRFPRVGSHLEARPAILVVDGVVNQEMLSLERLTSDEILNTARQHGIASLQDVRYAVLEADGKISFTLAEPNDVPPED